MTRYCAEWIVSKDPEKKNGGVGKQVELCLRAGIEGSKLRSESQEVAGED